MAKERKPIDISRVPELLRIVEEVRTTGETRVLTRDGEDLALVTPVRSAGLGRAKPTPNKAAFDAFLSSAGSWNDVDTDTFVAELYDSRSHSTRPPIEL